MSAQLLTPYALIAQAVAKQPDATAILSHSGPISFAELSAQVVAASTQLSALNLQKGDNVALFFRSQPEALIAAVAVNSIGGVLVPLDPDQPLERTVRILESTLPGAIIADSSLMKGVAALGSPVVTLPAPSSMAVAPNTPLSTEDPACIVFTSGSTGVPKGVVRTQGAVTARLGWGPFSRDDVFCHYMPLSHGLSLERLFLPLMLGLPIAVLPDGCQKDPRAFISELERFGVTQLTVAPAILHQTLRGPADRRLNQVRSVTSGSAFLLDEAISEFYRILPQAQLLNVYGSTESGTLTMGVMSASEGPSVGRPVQGMSVYVLDENMQPIAPGVTGEVCGGGPNTATGYWRNAELTAERFVPNPMVSDGSSKTIYRTGDLGRFLPDGRLELVGRRDRQVKVRGYRVEPAEIEIAIRSCPDVADVLVTGESIGSYSRLIAYVCSSSRAISVTEVRAHLKNALPNYMYPSAYVFLDELPRTPLGKLDHELLPKPGFIRPPQAEAYEPPLTEFENEIALIWADVLKLDCVGRNDHFIDLGGDSMVAVCLSNALEERLRKSVGPVTLFEHPTVAELAAVLSDDGGKQDL